MCRSPAELRLNVFGDFRSVSTCKGRSSGDISESVDLIKVVITPYIDFCSLYMEFAERQVISTQDAAT